MWMRKHKAGLLIFIKICVFSLGLILLVTGLSKVLNRKTEDYRLESFFTQEQYDVLFLGASHVRDGIFPMELWKDYGIVSFNFSGSTSSIAQEYWVMRNAFDYITPSLVVMDCSQLSYDEKMSPTVGHLHEVIDPFPTSLTKVQAITDLTAPADWMQFLWRFSYYHNRWSELSETDFSDGALENVLRGATYYVNVADAEETIKLDRGEKLEQETVSMVYLRKLIEECQSRGIDVLLTYLPFQASEEKQREANTVWDIAEEYGVGYVNFLDMDVVDYETDCLDTAHLNPSGAEKICAWIGSYIKENYDVPDRSQEEAYSDRWNADYETYQDFKLTELRKQNDLENYLMLLSDNDYSLCVYIDEAADITEHKKMRKLLQNVAWRQDMAIPELNGQDYFMVMDNGQQRVWESQNGATLENVGTTFGTVNYGADENGDRYLCIGDQKVNYLESVKQDPGAEVFTEVKIVVIRRSTGEIVDIAEFYENEKHEKRGT